MTADRWKQVQNLFVEAADLPAADRAAFLDAACRGDSELRRELDSLFQYDSQPASPLTAVISDTANSLAASKSMVGRRIGPYRLVELADSGGMGDVYLAVRDDGQFEKRVAIKFVRAGLTSQAALDRFRYERRILAQLDHPYIAKLLDGGTDGDGHPYFVMEYVQGQPINEYCAARRFTVQQKCDLFIKVCEAVSYAHRNLVIHRDLKPRNILVTDDGDPKLLDFGIAKLMAEGAPGAGDALTAVMDRPLTPDYASPEQVRGELLNTTTDVYSLGAVLFELFTAARPHSFTTYTPSEIEKAVCQTEVRRPSSLAAGGLKKQLAGDPDNIVLMAMRNEWRRRYQSVEDLRDDLQRYLKGLPVRARDDTAWYRASKFLGRHWFGAAAAGLILAAIIGGAITTDMERRKAESHRATAEAQRQRAEREHAAAEKQRDAAVAAQQLAEAKTQEADAQRKRSDERLQQLTGLANESLFKIHDEIASLPGATEARKHLVESTKAYLDQMAKDSGDDPGLLGLLVSSYQSLGEIQGLPFRANLGDISGALQSLSKAETVLDKLMKQSPNDYELLMKAIGLYQVQGEIYRYQSRRKEALERMNKGLAAANQVAALRPREALAKLQPGIMHHSLAQLLMESDVPQASRHVQTEIAIYTKMIRDHPADETALNQLASAHLLASEAEAYVGHLQQAASYLHGAVEIREKLVQQHPTDSVLERNLLVAYGRLADILGGSAIIRNLGDREGAIANYRKALALAERMQAADANDHLAQADVETALARLGVILDRPGELDEALASLRRAEALCKSALALAPTNMREKRALASIYDYTGRRLEQLDKQEDALASYRASLELAEALFASDATTAANRSLLQTDYKDLAALLASRNDRPGALEAAEKMRVHAEKTAAADAGNYRSLPMPARSYEATGSVYANLARVGSDAAQRERDWRDARGWFERGRDAWTKLGEIPELRPVDAEIARLTVSMAECDAQLGVAAK
jgi:tRNA A-37 threonylcarbamoyl transferase component Bud32/tetratricopeptide (TPR) repeat protein